MIPAIANPSSLMILSDEDLEFFCNRLYQLAGIKLSGQKADLVAGRLKPFLHRQGISTFTEYRQALQNAPADHSITQQFINLLTTNKTEFFRESKHFELLIDNVVPEILQRKKKTKHLNLWSAACSSGEEAYSISMCLHAAIGAEADFNILATDIDTDVLTRARNGVYPEMQLREIPENFATRFTCVGNGSAAGWFKVRKSAHERVRFDQYNLMSARSIPSGPFDVIFCRNVLIYFSSESQALCLESLQANLKPGGYLFIGHSESLAYGISGFSKIFPSVYVKK